MIHLKKTDKIIDTVRAGNRVYKPSLRERALLNERELKIIKKYGSMAKYKAIKKAELKSFIKDVLTWKKQKKYWL